MDLYEARGFNITAIHGDNRFNIKTLKALLLPIYTHIYGKEDHFGIIERMIGLIKERLRCMGHAIPYQSNIKLIIQSFISCVVKWLNAFPTKFGILKTITPSMIVKRKSNPYFNQESIVFGSHTLAYTGTINDIKRRSVPPIALMNQTVMEDIVS